jgi:catechol 2,3-dioxygenase-like lactoylglutathione lyase family enzyme
MGEAVLSAGGTNLELQPRRDSRGYSFNHADDRPRNLAEPPVKQSIGLVCLVVRDYDEALAFYVGKLGFRLVEDTPVPEQDKRWVVIAPPSATECRLLLARASSPAQDARVGDQTGGRVFLFLYTDNFERDYAAFRRKGVVFVREPSQQPYGTVAVFQDPWGNLWDLLQPRIDPQAGLQSS